MRWRHVAVLAAVMVVLSPAAQAFGTDGTRETSPVAVAPMTVVKVPGCPPARTASALRAPAVLPIDLVVLLDRSGSMPKSDPTAAIYRVARRAVQFLATAAPDLCHRVAFVRFGSRVSRRYSTPLVPVSRAVSNLGPALVPGPSLGATRFAPPLTEAATILGAPVPGRLRVVVAMTDGALNDPAASPGQESADVRRAVASLRGAALHLLILDRPRRFEPREGARWKKLGATTVNRLDGGDTQLDRLLTSLLARDLGLVRGAEATISPGREATVDVGPLRRGLVVSAVALDRGSVVDLVGPAGEKPRRLKARLSVVSVQNPRRGTWRIRVLRGGAVRVAADLVPPDLSLTVARQPWPAGRPLELRLRSRTLGAVRARESITAQVRLQGPAGVAVSAALVPNGVGRFSAPGIALQRPGTYTAEATVRVDGRRVALATLKGIRISAVPYLAVPSPRIDARRRLSVPVELRLAGSPVDARRVLADDPTGVVQAVVIARSGGAPKPADVRWVGGPNFLVTSTHKPADGQRVTVRLTMGARGQDGGEVFDHAAVVVVARPTPGDLAAEDEARILSAFAFAVALFLLAYAVWLLTRPRMVGRTTVGGRPVTVGAKKVLRLPGPRWWQATWVVGRRGPRGPIPEIQVGLLPYPWGQSALRSRTTQILKRLEGGTR